MTKPPRYRVAIPERLTLRGRRWRVVLAERLPKPDDGTDKPRGVCVREKREVWIDSSQPRVEQERTFVHELLHGLFPLGIVDPETEERIVVGLEERLHAAIASGALMAIPDEARPR